jgi:hypothetical protein
VVEGQPRTHCLKNVNHNPLQIIQNLDRRYPQCRNPMRQQLPIPPLVKRWLIATIMRLAINLNCQPCFGTKEIEHVKTGRMLFPKLEPAGPQLQLLPQQNLRQRHRSAQPPRTMNGIRRSRQHLNPPRHGEVAVRRTDGGAVPHRNLDIATPTNCPSTPPHEECVAVPLPVRGRNEGVAMRRDVIMGCSKLFWAHSRTPCRDHPRLFSSNANPLENATAGCLSQR